MEQIWELVPSESLTHWPDSASGDLWIEKNRTVTSNLRMLSGPDAQRNRARLMIWWIVWGGILGGLAILYYFLGRGQPISQELSRQKMFTGLIGLVPLFVSVIIRWLVMPRYTEMNRAFVMFVIGLALAEACGLFGIFFGGPYKDDLFLIGIFGIVQYVPFFAQNYVEPKSSGFIPNN